MSSKNALKDGNSVATLLAVRNDDLIQGTNKIRITVNPSDNGISVDETSTISFTMQPIDNRDDNYVGVWAFEGTDHQLYPAVATAAGALLINHN
jgi:hypothetical protein